MSCTTTTSGKVKTLIRIKYKSYKNVCLLGEAPHVEKGVLRRSAYQLYTNLHLIHLQSPPPPPVFTADVEMDEALLCISVTQWHSPLGHRVKQLKWWEVCVHAHAVLVKGRACRLSKMSPPLFKLVTWCRPVLIPPPTTRTFKHTYISVLRGVAGWRQTRLVWLGLVHHDPIALPQQSGLGFLVLVSFFHTCSSTDLYSSSLNT